MAEGKEAKDQTITIMKEKMEEYLSKLEGEGQLYQQEFQRVTKGFQEAVARQIQQYFDSARQHFGQHRKPLHKELNALKYYHDQPHSQESRNSLYPLFTRIDEKLAFNCHIINSSQLRVSLPQKTAEELDEEVLGKKVALLEDHLRQLVAVVRSEAVRKYCKREAEAAEKSMKYYGGLLGRVKETVYQAEVKMKRSFEEAVLELGSYRQLERLSLWVTAPGGILVAEDYRSLLRALYPNRLFLSSLALKIMDMEFSQEKCDILRKGLGLEFPQLTDLSLHNYYRECKLGLFQDFSWHPYRKKVHITSGVWS